MNLIPTIIFWFIAVLIAVSAIGVVSTRNILHAAFSLCMTFLGVAGLYVFLQADFIAAVQLIVYVGGILVLIMFGIMFSVNSAQEVGEQKRHPLAIGAGLLTAAAIFISIVLLTRRLYEPLREVNTFVHRGYEATVSLAPGSEGLGHYLVGRYLLPFEVVSILLLAALIGAVVIVRKELKE